MSLNFPSNPAPGQIFTVGDESWQWEGHCWQPVAGGQVYAPVKISPFPPPAPVHGDLWWNSDTGRMCIYYTDADSSQWVSAFQPPKARIEVDPDQVVSAFLLTLQEFGDIPAAVVGGIPVGGLFKVPGAVDVSGIRVVSSYP